MADTICPECNSANGHLHDCPFAQAEKSPLLVMAEHYYEVSAHLTRQGTRMLEIAESLGKMADDMCEQNIKETPLPSTVGAKP